MWDSTRTPIWRTSVQSAVSFKESRIGLALYPVIRFDLQYEFLRDYLAPSELKSLVGLFQAMRGRYDTFLYTDPTFNTVVDEPFGTGDGSTTQFQIIATFQNSGGPGGSEIIQNFNGTPTVKKAGTLQSSPSQYTLGATGIITFVTAPTAGQALTWSGSFYYRCRFMDDEQTVTQFMNRFWSAKKVSFMSVKL